MSLAALGRPEANEYASYQEAYVSMVQGDDVIRALDTQRDCMLLFLRTTSEERVRERYDPLKWSIKEVLGHVIDTERVFEYRALRFARGDETELHGFDQDRFVKNANYHDTPIALIADQYNAVRRSTLALFRYLAPEAWSRGGIANRNRLTVRGIAWVIAGHELHHQATLKTRYNLDIGGKP